MEPPGPLARGIKARDVGLAVLRHPDPAVPEVARRGALDGVLRQVGEELLHVEGPVPPAGHGFGQEALGVLHDVTGDVLQRDVGAVVGPAPPLQHLHHGGDGVHVPRGPGQALLVPLQHVLLAHAVHRLGIQVGAEQVRIVDAIDGVGLDHHVG